MSSDFDIPISSSNRSTSIHMESGSDPWAMVREVEHLSTDLARLVPEVSKQLWQLWPTSRWSRFERVVLAGNGDSLHAAKATAFAIRSLGGVPCCALGTLPLVAYDSASLAYGDPSRTLVVAISASGRTPGAVAALQAARSAGAATLAITGAAIGGVSEVADHTLVLALPDREPSPGVRTWQASVVGLLLLAIILSEGKTQTTTSEELIAELLEVGSAIADTRAAVREYVDALVTRIASVPAILVLGSGPSHGVAMFGAAKLVEAAGRPAFAQDAEEWRHVERLLHPVTLPIIMIAPPGQTHTHAVDIARLIKHQDRYLIAVAQPGDALMSLANVGIPVIGQFREVFSPLITHIFTTELAPRVASHIGRRSFQHPGLA